VRIASLSCILQLISNNPYSRNFSMHDVTIRLQDATKIQEEYVKQKELLSSVLGIEVFEKVMTTLRQLFNNNLSHIQEDFITLANRMVESEFGLGIEDISLGTRQTQVVFQCENTISELCHKLKETEKFIVRFHSDLLLKLYSVLKLALGSGPLFCKETVTGFFNIVKRLSEMKVSINWKYLLECINPNTDTLFIKECASLLVANYLQEDGNLTKLVSVVSVACSTIYIVPWVKIFKYVKEEHDQVSLSEIMNICMYGMNDANHGSSCMFLLLVLCMVDSSMTQMCEVSSLKSALDNFIASPTNKITTGYVFKIVEEVYKQDRQRVSWIESFIENNITLLLTEIPEETLSLIYHFPNKRRIAYYGIGKVETVVWKSYLENKEVSSSSLVSI